MFKSYGKLPEDNGDVDIATANSSGLFVQGPKSSSEGHGNPGNVFCYGSDGPLTTDIPIKNVGKKQSEAQELVTRR